MFTTVQNPKTGSGNETSSAPHGLDYFVHFLNSLDASQHFDTFEKAHIWTNNCCIALIEGTDNGQLGSLLQSHFMELIHH